MAQHASAKKRIRTTARRRTVNRSRVSRFRTMLRKVEEAIAAGDHAAAMAAFRAAQADLMRGAQRGVVHARTAARRLSRLNARVRALA